MAEFVEVEGDLFDPKWGFQAIAHGCNCMGVMGAGVAREVRNRYPGAYQVYKDECIAGRFNLGDYHGVAVDFDEQRQQHFIVFNLATQYLPGPVPEHGADQVQKSYAAISQTLHGALTDCAAIGIDTLGVPEIGCGIADLDWSIVSSIMKTLVSDIGVGITVVHYVQ